MPFVVLDVGPSLDPVVDKDSLISALGSIDENDIQDFAIIMGPLNLHYYIVIRLKKKAKL